MQEELSQKKSADDELIPLLGVPKGPIPFGLTLLAFTGLVLLGASLWVPLLMAGVFSILLTPLHHRLVHKVKWNPSISALMLTLGLTFLGLTPAAVLIFVAARGVITQVQNWKTMARPEADAGIVEGVMQNEAVHRFIEKLSSWFPIGVDEIASSAEDLVRGLGSRLAEVAGDFLSSLPSTAVGTAMMILAVYFLTLEGRRFSEWLKGHIPLHPRKVEQVFGVVSALSRSVLLASVVSGLAQSLVFGVALLVAGAPSAGLTTLLVFLCSFLPLVGSAPITFGTAIHAFLVLHDRNTALILLGAAAGVSLVDNVVRPWVLKGSGNLHPFLAFVAAFGGLHVFGFSGIFLGPILAGLCVALLTPLEGGSQKSIPSDSKGDFSQLLPASSEQKGEMGFK